MRALCEAQNPLLSNEEQWEDDGIDEEPHGKVALKEMSCVLTSMTNAWITTANQMKKKALAKSLGVSDLTNEYRLKISPILKPVPFF